jgi:hypothetical protein
MSRVFSFHNRKSTSTTGACSTVDLVGQNYKYNSVHYTGSDHSSILIRIKCTHTQTITHIQEVITISNFSLATIPNGTSTRRLEMRNVTTTHKKNTTYQSIHLAFQHSTDSAVVPTMQKYQPKSELPILG